MSSPCTPYKRLKLINYPQAEKISDETLAEFKEAFGILAKSEDGSISVNELQDYLKAFKHNLSESELREMINKIDADGNDVIDFREFLSLMSGRLHENDIEAAMKEAFKSFDRDGDGLINASDLRHISSIFGKNLTDAQSDEMIQDADLDGDGKINYEEFMKMMSDDN